MRTLLALRASGVPISQQNVRARRSGFRDVHADAGLQNHGVGFRLGPLLRSHTPPPGMSAIVLIDRRQPALVSGVGLLAVGMINGRTEVRLRAGAARYSLLSAEVTTRRTAVHLGRPVETRGH
ncbi:hypothetical protein [Bradyrhizobium sp. OAE829]|uniref:hypothetical protein n=1 Tax=Bradyrhizobium sp. OAE829 TaxID=2663807 RepID=UPI001789F44B